jgi:prepilin-type N-terminal cleavage/methylation domain-containing protein
MRTQRGFTLVEIAIVLVIIGLLLGGILKGQELITSARVRNVADQSSGVQAAYYGFVDRYRKIPGDMHKDFVCSSLGATALPNCANISGDGNGRINDGSYPESSAAWAHLAAAGFLQGSYAGTATDDNTYKAGTQAPINVFGGSLILQRHKGYLSNATTVTERLNLVLGRNMPVGVAKELDTKLDDGRPDRGVLRSVQNTSGPTVFDSGPPACTKTSAAAADGGAAGTEEWDIASEADDCNAVFLY